MPVAVTRGDITKAKCDAIVNPIGSGLYSGELTDLACGKSKVTSVSDMPYNFVIHTANPMWRASSVKRGKVLDFTYKDAVKIAIQRGFRSIIVPLVIFADDEENGYLALDEARQILEKLISRFKLKMHIFIAVIEKRRNSESSQLFSQLEQFISTASEDDPFDDVFGDTDISPAKMSFCEHSDRASGVGDDVELFSGEVFSYSADRMPRERRRTSPLMTEIVRDDKYTAKSKNISNDDSETLFSISRKSAHKSLRNCKRGGFAEYAFISSKSGDRDTSDKAPTEAGVIPAESFCERSDARPSIPAGESGSVLWEDDFDFENDSLEKFLKKRLKNESFAKALFQYIDQKDMKDTDAYKNARVSKQTFSKIKNASYNPSKATVLLFALGLRLTIKETEHLLSTAGFCLSRTNKIDIIVEFFIRSGKYNNVDEVNDALYEYGYTLINAS